MFSLRLSLFCGDFVAPFTSNLGVWVFYGLNRLAWNSPLPLVWIYPLGLQICHHFPSSICAWNWHTLSHAKRITLRDLRIHLEPFDQCLDKSLWYLLNCWNSPCPKYLLMFVLACVLHYRGWPPSSFCFPWSPVLMDFFTSMWKVSNFIVCDQSHVLDLHYSLGQEGCFQSKEIFC